jgi:hypothetical protein
VLLPTASASGPFARAQDFNDAALTK